MRTSKETNNKPFFDPKVILESISDAFFAIDCNWNFTYLNSHAEKLLNKKRDLIIGKNIWDIYPKANSIFYKNYSKALKTHKSVEFEVEHQNKWFEFHVYPNSEGLSVFFLDITDSKNIQNKIKESETKFKELADSMPQLIWTASAEGVVDYYNKKKKDFEGLRQVKGSYKWELILHPDDLDATTTSWSEAVKNKSTYEMEHRIKVKGGEYIWHLSRAIPVLDKNGNIDKWYGTATDIHKQRILSDNQKFLAEAGKTLASSLNYKKNLKMVADLAVPYIADWCTVEILNPSVEGGVEMVALSHKDSEKIKWAYQIKKKYPTNINDHENGIGKIIKTKQPEYYPYISEELIRMAAKTEEDYKIAMEIGYTSLIMVPLIVDDKVIGIISLISTESQKRFTADDLQMAQELAARASISIQNSLLYSEVKKSEVKFKGLYDSNIIGIHTSDLQGNLIDGNDAFLKMIDKSRIEIESGEVTLKSLVAEEYQEVEQLQLEKLKKDFFVQPYEKEYIRKDGTRTPVLVGRVLFDVQKGLVISFALDITERKVLEQRKDEFISIASHELKTPLTSIKAYTQLLERITASSEDQKAKQLISRTNLYIDKLSSLITDLLDVSKIQAGKLQLNISEFNFDDFVKECIEGMQLTTSSHTIKLWGQTNSVITGDRQRLEQVVQNLLNNAIKYSPNANKVDVKISKQKHTVKLQVTDYGVGISKSEQDKLFNRFYRVERTANDFSGLGIGLYVSSEIVKRHKGKISVNSIEDIGSTFTIVLPLS